MMVSMRLAGAIVIRGAVAACFGVIYPGVPALAGSPASCPSLTFEVVATEGEPAPGAGGDLFSEFGRPNLSSNGSLAFTADTDDAGLTGDTVYVDFNLLVQAGMEALGVPGGTHSSFEFFETSHQLSAVQNVAFISTLEGVPAEGNRAVYRTDTLIALEGTNPPGIGDRLYVDFGFVGLADDGSVGFLADLDGSISDDSIIVFDGAVLYRQGDPVPVLDGLTWDGDFSELQWNGNGDLLFVGNTSQVGGDLILVRRTNTDKRGAVEEIVAQEGMTVDASGGEDFLELFLQSALAENGMWGFRGNLEIAPAESDAIILTESGFQVQQGDEVPELPGVVLGNFNGMAINSLGDVLYLADLDGATPPGADEALFLNGCLIVLDGAAVPGLEGGDVVTDLKFESLAINDQNRIVLGANTTAGEMLISINYEDVADCPADLDRSGEVGFGDLLILLSTWDDEGVPADFDGGGVGFSDLLILLAAWGPC